MSRLEPDFDQAFRDHLPTPLALLYVSFHNSQSGHARHLSSYYMLEGLIRITASVLAATYIYGPRRTPETDQFLRDSFKVPSTGSWVGIIRKVAKYLKKQDTPEAQMWTRDLLSNRREELPMCASALATMAGHVPAINDSIPNHFPLMMFFDAVPQYRNAVIGHAGLLSEDTYDELATSLAAVAIEIVNCLSIFRDGGLVFIEEIRRGADQDDDVELWNLSGTTPMREIVRGWERSLLTRVRPRMTCWRTGSRLLDLHPFIVCEASPDQDAALFLDRFDDKGRIEFLDYLGGKRSPAEDLKEALQRDCAGKFGGSFQPSADPPPSPEEEPTQDWEKPSAGDYGDFESLVLLGKGGMGEVYLARQRSIERLVALKVLKPQTGSGPETELRFEREIRALARLDHPSVVRIIQSGRTDGVVWYAMDFVEGCSLREVIKGLASVVDRTQLSEAHIFRVVRSRLVRIQQLIKEGSPLPEHDDLRGPALRTDLESYYIRCARIAQEIAEGLHHLHQNGVLHRDVKPANLMLTYARRTAAIADLGLARLLEEPDVTGDRLLGTLNFCPPEHLRKDPNRFSPQADIYSLGATMYELVTGQPQHGTDTGVEAVLSKEPAPARAVDPNVPEALERIIMRCVRKDPADRYGTAAELADDLEQLVRDKTATPIVGGETESQDEPQRKPRRHLLWRGLGMLLLAALLLGGREVLETLGDRSSGVPDLQLDIRVHTLGLERAAAPIQQSVAVSSGDALSLETRSPEGSPWILQIDGEGQAKMWELNSLPRTEDDRILWTVEAPPVYTILLCLFPEPPDAEEQANFVRTIQDLKLDPQLSDFVYVEWATKGWRPQVATPGQDTDWGDRGPLSEEIDWAQRVFAVLRSRPEIQFSGYSFRVKPGPEGGESP